MAVRIDVVTLFPDMVAQAAGFGVTGRARERGLWQLGLWNPRDFTTDSHRTVDDRPYGGGPGMVMLGEPLSRAIAAAKAAQVAAGVSAPSVIHLSPAGVPLTHEHVLALALAVNAGYVLLAGRYEGIDERLLAQEANEEIAIGDFVVSGGELPALMLIDAIARQLPGALNDEQSAQQDSFAAGLLDCPHYTRPEVLDGVAVPGVLMSGHHAEIRRWRLKQSLDRTLTKEESALLAEYQREHCLREGK
jgi:tRNA (guanine37-N1)-methyltransferase